MLGIHPTATEVSGIIEIGLINCEQQQRRRPVQHQASGDTAQGKGPEVTATSA
jgi:hypothetical protein